MPQGQYDPGYLTIAHRLHHYKQLRLKLEAHNTMAESIQLRKKWLEAQKRATFFQVPGTPAGRRRLIARSRSFTMTSPRPPQTIPKPSPNHCEIMPISHRIHPSNNLKMFLEMILKCP